MRIPPPPSSEWTRIDRWALGGLIFFVLGSMLVLVHPWYDVRIDAAMYIETARSIAAGDGISYLEEPFRIRPPGYPILLAALIGDGIPNFRLLNLLGSSFGALAVVLLFIHQRVRTGWLVALLVSVAVWLNAGFQHMSTQVMTDVPGIALVMACLLVNRWACRDQSVAKDVVLGVLIALVTLIRANSLLVLPAILLERILSQRRVFNFPFLARRIAALTLTFVLLAGACVLVLWEDPPRQVVDQSNIHSIATGMWHTDPRDPDSPRISISEFLSRPATHAGPMMDVAGSRMQSTYGPNSKLSDAKASLPRRLVALCLLAGLLTASWIHKSAFELFALASLVLTLLYFSFVDRLLLPAYVVAFASTVNVLWMGIRRKFGPRVASITVASLLVTVILLDMPRREYWKELQLRHKSFLELANSARSIIEPDARVGTIFGPQYSVFLDRPIWSFIFALERANGDYEAVERIIDKYRLDTVLVWSKAPMDRQLIPYLERRYGSPRRSDGALSWQVR